jgi:small subunit ribosomal protein S13
VEEKGARKAAKTPEKKTAKGAAPKGPVGGEKKEKFVPDNPDFRYIVRLANTDLDGRRPLVMALTGIRGIGVRVAEATAQLSGLNPGERLGNFSETQVEGLEGLLSDLGQHLPPWMLNRPLDRVTGESRHLISADVEAGVRDDVNLMKMIRCYKGIRHEKGQKVRGQRTKSNGRTGMAAGVLKKAAKEAQAKGSSGESKKEK